MKFKQFILLIIITILSACGIGNSDSKENIGKANLEINHGIENIVNNIGLVELDIVNKSNSNVKIERLEFITPSTKNKLVEKLNYCNNMILKPYEKCKFSINFEEAGYETFKQKYESILIEEVRVHYNDNQSFIFSFYNMVRLPDIKISYDCRNSNYCNLNFISESKTKDLKITLESIYFSGQHTVEFVYESSCYGLEVESNSLSTCKVMYKQERKPIKIYGGLMINFKYTIDGIIYHDELSQGVFADGGLAFKENISTVSTSCKTHSTTKVPDTSQSFIPYTLNVSAFLTSDVTIKKVEYIESATNYEWFDKKILNNTPIIENCTGEFIKFKGCTIILDGGCEGHGSAGKLKFTYTLKNENIEYSDIYDLPEIAQPDIDIQYGISGAPADKVWSNSNPIDSVTIPFHQGDDPGFWIHVNNGYIAGTYVVPITNLSIQYYSQFMDTGGTCFGKRGEDLSDIYFPPGVYSNDTSCLIGLEDNIYNLFVNKQFIYQLKVGNHGQYTINFIFNLVD